MYKILPILSLTVILGFFGFQYVDNQRNKEKSDSIEKVQLSDNQKQENSSFGHTDPRKIILPKKQKKSQLAKVASVSKHPVSTSQEKLIHTTAKSKYHQAKYIKPAYVQSNYGSTIPQLQRVAYNQPQFVYIPQNVYVPQRHPRACKVYVPKKVIYLPKKHKKPKVVYAYPHGNYYSPYHHRGRTYSRHNTYSRPNVVYVSPQRRLNQSPYLLAPLPKNYQYRGRKHHASKRKHKNRITVSYSF